MEIAWIGTLLPATVIFFTDLIWKRIYNLITLPAIVAGLVYHATCGAGIKFAVLGFAVMFAIGFIGFAVNGWGGGDTKMMVLIGAWLGWHTSVLVLLAGCLVALASFGVKLRKEALRRVKDQLIRIWTTVYWRAGGAWKGFQGLPEGGSAGPPTVPFGCCLAAGAWFVMLVQYVN